MKKLVGRLLVGLAGLVAAFWSVVTVAGLVRLQGRSAEAATDPGEPTMLVLRLLLWSILAAVIFALGRRLADPRRLEREVLEIARSALEEDGAGTGEPVRTDRVSALYGDLSLRELVLVLGAIDGTAWRDRHRALLEQIRLRLREAGPEEPGAAPSPAGK